MHAKERLMQWMLTSPKTLELKIIHKRLLIQMVLRSWCVSEALACQDLHNWGCLTDEDSLNEAGDLWILRTPLALFQPDHPSLLGQRFPWKYPNHNRARCLCWLVSKITNRELPALKVRHVFNPRLHFHFSNLFFDPLEKIMILKIHICAWVKRSI